jgi:prepilin-type N-terminal cleavage/methylation domain-containing protein
MKKFKLKQMAGQQGVTLVELLVYMAVVGVVMGAIYTAFKRQQDSYLTQERLAILQQNLRGAMYLVASDLQMAGYYTCYDQLPFPFPAPVNQTVRPMILGTNLDPDTIVVIKANGQDWRRLQTGTTEGAAQGANQITLNSLDLDGDGDSDFDIVNQRFGVIVKTDLTRAEFFMVNGTGPLTVTPAAGTFQEPYFASPTAANESDLIARADVIVYSLDTTTNSLMRQNLGEDFTGTPQIVAEYITDLQLRYAVVDEEVGEVWVNSSSGTKPAPPTGDGKTYDERDIRRVEVTITGTVQISPALGSKTRTFSSTIKVRNMGMDAL